MKIGKINEKDIKEDMIQVQTPVFIIGGAIHFKSMTTKQALATHKDCDSCGIEFEKRYTNSKLCPKCEYENSVKKYKSFELVEWDQQTPLCIYNSDIYFFDIEDIINHCEEHEQNIEDLMLVLCTETHFDEIDLQDIVDGSVHEDWEPEQDLIDLVENLNKYLREKSTNTWIPTKKRVILNKEIL